MLAFGYFCTQQARACSTFLDATARIRILVLHIAADCSPSCTSLENRSIATGKLFLGAGDSALNSQCHALCSQRPHVCESCDYAASRLRGPHTQCIQQPLFLYFLFPSGAGRSARELLGIVAGAPWREKIAVLSREKLVSGGTNR